MPSIADPKTATSTADRLSKPDSTDDPAHQQPAELPSRSDDRQQASATHDQLMAVIAARPATQAIIPGDRHVDGTYTKLLATLAT